MANQEKAPSLERVVWDERGWRRGQVPLALIVMTPVNEAVCDFTVYQALYEEDGKVVLNDDKMSGSPAASREAAAVHMRGHVKFDGCMNFVMHDDGTMAHICGPDGWEDHMRAVREVYNMASEMMPGNERYLLLRRGA